MVKRPVPPARARPSRPCTPSPRSYPFVQFGPDTRCAAMHALFDPPQRAQRSRPPQAPPARRPGPTHQSSSPVARYRSRARMRLGAETDIGGWLPFTSACYSQPVISCVLLHKRHMRHLPSAIHIHPLSVCRGRKLLVTRDLLEADRLFGQFGAASDYIVRYRDGNFLREPAQKSGTSCSCGRVEPNGAMPMIAA
jgi:hypothetical protein